MQTEAGRPVVGRFAPTPSGRMHLGNLLCALLAWLSARSAGGRILLRIEDLDPERCPLEHAHRLAEDLAWFGLDWDEGGANEEADAAYFQSRRTGIYLRFFGELEQRGLLYPCFCSRGELHAASAPHLSDGSYVYSGKCRNLSAEEVAQKRLQRSPAYRLRVPEETIGFLDRNCGWYQEDLARDCGDFILRRSDGVFAYQLAVVVDDGLMGVTEVVRGRDLLSSTPRQICLFRLLGMEPPAFAHIPLLLAPDGSRLSKRDGSLDLGRLRERHTPEELLGILAHTCGLLPRAEAVTAQELIPLFDWGKIPTEDVHLPASLWE